MERNNKGGRGEYVPHSSGHMWLGFRGKIMVSVGEIETAKMEYKYRLKGG